jgi:hypothetical protein
MASNAGGQTLAVMENPASVYGVLLSRVELHQTLIRERTPERSKHKRTEGFHRFFMLARLTQSVLGSIPLTRAFNRARDGAPVTSLAEANSAARKA